MVRAYAVWPAALLLALTACAAPAPAPKPTAPPATATAPSAPSAQPAVAPPTPSPEPDMGLGEDAEEAILVFLDDLAGVIDETSVMAEAPCDELKQAQAQDPNVFRSVRGYAATLKRVAAQSPELNEDDEVKATLVELDTTMGQLDGALRLCGIALN